MREINPEKQVCFVSVCCVDYRHSTFLVEDRKYQRAILIFASHLSDYCETHASLVCVPCQAKKVKVNLSFKEFPDQLNFPQMEETVLGYWKEINAFKTSLKKSDGYTKYTFYSRPPVVAGLPTFDHILPGLIQDVVCRYAHQTGHCVERPFAWDCHGLPIEREIEKILGMKSSHDVNAYGFANYNAKCREVATRFSEEWEKTLVRMGRWMDSESNVKTMNLNYMESVWWVFKQLFDKGLVYRGIGVLPYSTGCTTPVSDFECKMNHRDVCDPSLIVTFPLVEDPNTQLLSWTTSPWTLPSNLAIVVHPTMTYVKVLDKATGRNYILAKGRIEEVYKKQLGEENYTILEEFPGEKLGGKRYIPLFKYFEKWSTEGNAFQVLVDEYVTSTHGTGVVHCAPGFGEDDYRVCRIANVLPEDVIVCPVDENGCFTGDVTNYAGKYIKDCDDEIAKMLKDEGRVIFKGTVVRSVPFCWLSETPLIHKTAEAWFVRVEALRDKLLQCNADVRWIPHHVQNNFSSWLERARDWNISRDRYWGTPIPLWASADFEEIICVGSVEELQILTGCTEVTNIHREYVDHLTIPSSREGNPPLKRVSQVFDCWFESACVPYAQKHYPFENKAEFENTFPADFIAEGVGSQTRTWFYTLLVLSTVLFERPPYEHVIVNGRVQESERRMTRRIMRCADPTEVVNKYGADALRLYFIKSSVVRAEPLKFREQCVKDVVKDVFLPLVNSAKLFVIHANRFVAQGHNLFLDSRSPNDMDRWIKAEVQTLVDHVHKEMSGYNLSNVVPGVRKFIDSLSNWYVRMNRRRIKGTLDDNEDWGHALNTMFHVLFNATRVLAPFCPFVSEFIYQHVKGFIPNAEDSVHYLMMPAVDASRLDADVESRMNAMMEAVTLVRVLRGQVKLRLKFPCHEVVIIHPERKYIEALQPLAHYIASEVNTWNVVFSCREDHYVTRTLEPNMTSLGQRIKIDESLLEKDTTSARAAARKKRKTLLDALAKAVHDLTPEQQKEFMDNADFTVGDYNLTMDDVKIIRNVKEGNRSAYVCSSNHNLLVLMNTEKDEAQIDAWHAREFVSKVQQLRKLAKLPVDEVVDVYHECGEEDMTGSIEGFTALINEAMKVRWVPLCQLPEGARVIAETHRDANVAGCPITIQFANPCR